MIVSEAAKTATLLSEKIAPMLSGFGPEIQGAVLADLTARWLACFQGLDAARVRAEILEDYVQQIVKLVPVNEAEITQRMTRQ